jgi:phosphopantothenate synthetase
MARLRGDDRARAHLAAYVGGVALSETLLAPVISGNGVAVAITTLAVVALFQPARRRIQVAVDRRFYRAKYDADHTLDAFASRLRDQVDLAALEAELLAVVGETVHPERASVWLRDGSAAAD